MKIYIIVLISIYLTGCAHFQNVHNEDSAANPISKNQVCKRIPRHKGTVKWCRQLTHEHKLKTVVN